ncbi:MAG: cation transporter [Gammaproteobacteria bacterium]|jgi:Co/Zn/Cd efflux system component|nr:cation transporter [Gammaproteobacteria bacterium]MBT7369304.1 cation transporter [Gammaproteobacteria bacterium]
MADCCGSDLETQNLNQAQRRVLTIVMLINLVTFVGMVAASWLSHSSALLSGTLDNLGDAMTYALSLAVVGASVAAKAKVALFKGILISLAAIAVAVQIGWRLLHPEVPIVTTMGIAAVLNLLANGVCLYLLSAHREDDVNMSSVWECSRNDVAEGLAVLVTVAAVWVFDSAWPDLIVALALLVLFSRSAVKVLTSAVSELRGAQTAGA